MAWQDRGGDGIRRMLRSVYGQPRPRQPEQEGRYYPGGDPGFWDRPRQPEQDVIYPGGTPFWREIGKPSRPRQPEQDVRGGLERPVNYPGSRGGLERPVNYPGGGRVQPRQYPSYFDENTPPRDTRENGRAGYYPAKSGDAQPILPQSIGEPYSAPQEAEQPLRLPYQTPPIIPEGRFPSRDEQQRPYDLDPYWNSNAVKLMDAYSQATPGATFGGYFGATPIYLRPGQSLEDFSREMAVENSMDLSRQNVAAANRGAASARVAKEDELMLMEIWENQQKKNNDYTRLKYGLPPGPYATQGERDNWKGPPRPYTGPQPAR